MNFNKFKRLQNSFICSAAAFLFLISFSCTSSNAETSLKGQTNRNEPESELAPWQLSLHFGFMTDFNHILGGSGQIGIGRIFGDDETMRLGLFYRYSLATTLDFGLLGGGGFQNQLLGTFLDIRLSPGHLHNLRLGVKLGRSWSTGIRAILFIPYAIDFFRGWAIGPKVSYTYLVSNSIAIGFRIDFLAHLPDSDSLDLSSFLTADSAFLIEFHW